MVKYYFIYIDIEKYSYKRRQWRPPSTKEKGGGKPTTCLRPRNMKACHGVSTALLHIHSAHKIRYL
jgi:hypothetical protein